MKEFDYYIYIDYSENLIGYIIIEEKKIQELLEKTKKMQHFRKVKRTKEYLAAIKKRIENENILFYLAKHRICNMRANTELFIEISDFIQKNRNSTIFISIDDNFYFMFIKLIKALNLDSNIKITRESKLRKHSAEYQLNLIIDNLLTIKRKNEE